MAPVTIKKPMLAATIESPDDLEKLHYPVLVSRKYDGVRCVVGDDGVPRTRKGEPFGNQWMASVIQSLDLSAADGEIGVGNPTDKDFFTRTSGFCRRGLDKQVFTFYIFDWMIPGAVPVRTRRRLPDSVEWPTWLNLERVIQYYCATPTEVLGYEDAFVKEGYEGIMIRGALDTAEYKYGRATMNSQELLKYKRFEDTEGVITDFIEGETNTNEKTQDALGHGKRSSAKAGKVPNGTAGVIRVKSRRFIEEVYIGTGKGLTQELRRNMWNNKEGFIGRTVTFTFQAGSDYKKPRFPSFKGFRDEGM